MKAKQLLFCKKIIFSLIFLIPFSIYAQCPLMPGSVLIDGNDEAKMTDWFGNNNTYRGTLLYRMSDNGASASTFHSLCDGKGPTLVIYKNSSTNQVFGGYNPQSWNSSNNYVSGTGGFLFNLTYDYKLNQTISNYQTYDNSSYGPTFGGGHDIYCQMNGGSSYNAPHSYENPSIKGFTYLSGSYNFVASEIEVYALTGGNISASGPTAVCAGGSVTLTASGGTSYLWSTGAVTPSIVANQTGNYSVTISNPNSECPNQTLSKAITVSPALSLTLIQTNSSSPGSCNGSVTLIPSGGTLPYNQGAGINFSGTTIDTNLLSYGGPGSQYNQNNELKFQSTSGDWNNYVWTKNTTPRVAGTIFQAKFKADPYSYTMIGWHDNSTTAYYSNMSHAIYMANGSDLYIYEHGNYVGYFGNYPANIQYDIKIELLTIGAKYYIKPVTSTAWTLITTTATWSDSDLRMGLVYVGYASYYPNSFFSTDDWSGGSGVNPPLTGLCAGVYNYTITDAIGCDASAQVTIFEGAPVNFSATSINQQCIGTANGSITINATGGNGTFLYSIDGGQNYSTNNIFNGIVAGTYSLKVKDGLGSVSEQTQEITIAFVDNIAPTAVTKNISVNLNASGNVNITPASIDNGSFDNCSIASYSIDKSNFNCSNIGDNTVTLTVTDGKGNISTKTATVTVQDNIAPTAITRNLTITLVNALAIITPSAINNGSFDNCSMATMTLSKSTFNCLNIGANTVTLTVTDANGNSSSANATVNVVGAIPTATITQEIQPGFTQGGAIVLTASSPTALSYAWAGGPADAVNNVYGSGNYTVTATNSFGCTFNVSANVNYTGSNLLSNYVIIGKKGAEIEGHSVVYNGGVGVTSVNGEAEVEDHSTITASGTFVSAKHIDVNGGSNVTTKILSATPSAILPVFLYNNYCNSNNHCTNKHHNSCGDNDSECNGNGHCNNSHHGVCSNNNSSNNNININKNSIVTINDSIIGTMEIGKNAIVTFTSPRIFMKKLDLKEGAIVKFSQCAVIRICDDVKIQNHAQFNTLNSAIVTLYVEKKVDVDEGSQVTANIYALGDIRIDGKSSAPTIMKGMFIGDEVKAEDYVNFYWNTTTYCSNNNYRSAVVYSETESIENNFDATVYPNPTIGDFKIQLSGSSSEPFRVDVYDMKGVLIESVNYNNSGIDQGMGLNYANGIYLIKITQGENSKNIRLVRTN